MVSYFIPENNLEYLQSAIDKLNKKALKCGSESIRLNITAETRYFKIVQDETTTSGWSSKEVDPNTETSKFQKAFKVEIEGTTPIINGWQFLSRIEHTESGNLMYVIPGMTVPVEYRKVERKCDHCGYNRKRNDTYLVINKETNEIKQIGSKCLADFLGHGSPEAIASFASMLTLNLSEILEIAENEFGEERFGRSEDYLSLPCLVSMSAAVIKAKGWVSSSKADELQKTPTKSLVSEQLYGRRYLKSDEIITPDADDIKEAELAISWIKETPEQENNDYLSNLKIIALNNCVTRRSFGMAVSLLATYQREMGKIKAFERKKPSEFVGTVGGGRQVFENLTCEAVYSFDSKFGVIHINRMTDSNGNIIIWKTGEKLTKNTVYSLVASVKIHEEYKSVKQTVLTRCKIKS